LVGTQLAGQRSAAAKFAFQPAPGARLAVRPVATASPPPGELSTTQITYLILVFGRFRPLANAHHAHADLLLE
jgi:hypothetical protein